MQKYKPLKQISKGPYCLIYTAIHIQNQQKVLIKRVKNYGTWDTILNNKNFIYINKQKMFPKVLQVIKNKKFFQIVFQNPYGYSLAQSEKIGKLDPQKFYSIMSQLCQAIITLKKFKPHVYIFPQWVYTNRNSIKLLHFQPFLSQGNDNSQNHVYLYNLQKKINGQNINLTTNNQKQDRSFQNMKNIDLVYNIGYIAYSLLTGVNPLKSQTHQQYLQKANQLSQRCQTLLGKVTKDQKLIKLITKMVGKNPFNAPTLQQTKNYFLRQNNLLNKNKKPKQIEPIGIQFEMQKIRISRIKQSKSKRRFVRQCCKTFQDQECQNHHKYFIISRRQSQSLTAQNKKSKNFKSHYRASSLLPKLGMTTNRHKIGLINDPFSKYTQQTRPTAFILSQDRMSFRDI